MTKLVPIKQEAAEMQSFNQTQIDILRHSICKGCSNEEFEVFLMACSKTQLDPFMKQIYAVKRGNTMTIQTGIDGYRLIAERTGYYTPGPEPTYTYDKDGRLLSATAYIKKQTRDGQWHLVSASAYYDEYCQKYNGKPSGMWEKMPRTMLAKCAESLALRKAFPAQMSGLHTSEEMSQCENEVDVRNDFITPEQEEELMGLIEACSSHFKENLWLWLKQKGVKELQYLKKISYEGVRNKVLEQIKRELQSVEETILNEKVDDEPEE